MKNKSSIMKLLIMIFVMLVITLLVLVIFLVKRILGFLVTELFPKPCTSLGICKLAQVWKSECIFEYADIKIYVGLCMSVFEMEEKT